MVLEGVKFANTAKALVIWVDKKRLVRAVEEVGRWSDRSKLKTK
jgi:hypothetical protein